MSEELQMPDDSAGPVTWPVMNFELYGGPCDGARTQARLKPAGQLYLVYLVRGDGKTEVLAYAFGDRTTKGKRWVLSYQHPVGFMGMPPKGTIRKQQL